MALVTKNDVTQIFAIQAPEVDLPPTFANYPRGWDTARSNNGKPTIKQFNYLQQRTDQNVLWIHQNGAALPYDENIEYAENAHVVKDGELQKKQGAGWVSATNKGYNLDYFIGGKSYPLHAEIMLANGDIVKSTVADNVIDPNVDMTGWVFDQGITAVTDLSESRRTDLNVALLKDEGFFYYDESKALDNNYGTVLNGWVRATGAVLTPKMFGAKADGVTNDKLAIERMFNMTSAGYRNFDFEGLSYYVGEVVDSLAHVFKLDTIPNLNIRNATDIHVTNAMSTTGNLYCPVFLFTDCDKLHAEVHVTGDVFVADGYYSGPSAVVLESSLVDAENCVIYASIKAGHSAFQTVTAWRLEARARLPTDPILRHVFVKAVTDVGKYGVRLIDSGENMHLTINTHSVSRSLSLVGASNVQAFINSHEQRNFADVLIKAYDNDVKNIYVKLNSINQTDARNPINIEHQNTHDSSKITGVTIDAHITGRTLIRSNGIPLAVIGRSYTRTGTIVVRSETNCITDNIQLNFTYDVMSQPALEFPSYANNGGQVEVNFYAHVRETNNFTIKHGNTLRVATAKIPNSQVLKLGIKHAVPSSVLCRMTVIGIEDQREHNFVNTHIKQYLVKLYVSSSTGTVTVVGTPTDILDGVNWGFGFSINEGKLFASSDHNISSAFSKFELLIEPIVGGNFI